MFSKVGYLFCCLYFGLTGFAQESELKIGQWQSHLPYHSGKWVTQSPTTIYYATPFSLFTIEKRRFRR